MIRLSGWLAFIFLLATFGAAMMKGKLKIHRILAIITLILVLAHIGLALLR